MKKINLNVKAVIFDMDGVITNTMPDHFFAWKTILAKEGVHVTHFDVYKREGQKGICSVEELFNENKKPFTKQKANKLLHRKQELFKKIVKLRFIQGSRSFVRLLNRYGYHLALVTGTSRKEVHQILPVDLYNLFNVIVTGSDVRNGKPDPEPYLLALKKLKLKSQEAVVIENAPFGIQSAKAAGLKCLAITTSLPQKHLKQADYIFSNFRDLRQNVDFIYNGNLSR